MVYSNEKFIIKEIEFDIPQKNDIKKWDYKEWKEGKNKYKSIWLDEYINDNEGVCICSHCLVSINGSKFLLDDKKLRGDDVENAKKIFKGIE
jgi:hypothetical protein